MVGIYKIENIINKKCYYGSSKNIEKRWSCHKNDLNKNKHDNSYLQRAWNKYGKENFIFEIVELCSKDCDDIKLKEIEQKYLDLKPKYNIAIKANGGDNITNNPNREKIIENIKHACKKAMNNLSTEDKKIKFSRPMEKNGNWKDGSSYVYCKCGKRIGYGNQYCQKCRPRTGKNNPFYGKSHTDEYKKKASDRQVGKYNGEQNKPIIIDDVEYRSAGVASKILKIPMVTIRWRILSKNPKYKTYHYKGEDKICYTKEEQHERISKHLIGRKTTNNKPFIIDDVKYETLNEASGKLKIHPMTIKGRLKSINKKFNNYKYI